MNYRVRRALFTAVMVVAMLAASVANAAEKPTSEALPAPNDAVTAVDGHVDVVAEIDHTAEPAAWVAVDRVVTATETVVEMTGNVGHVEDAAANAVRIQGLGAPAQVADIPVYNIPHCVHEVNEVAERAGPMDVGKVVDDVGRVDGVPVAVAAPTYEHRASEQPAPDIANLEPQDKLNDSAQEGIWASPPTIAFG